jgi:Ca2+-transporting ATPase
MRSEIKESVQICRNAGFTVRMVTGENIGTAKTIAIKAGILPENHK